MKGDKASPATMTSRTLVGRKEEEGGGGGYQERSRIGRDLSQ